MTAAVYAYFPDNYAWTMAVLMAAQLGGQMSEIEEACAPLKPLAAAGKTDPGAQSAWIERWGALAERIAGLAARDEQAGHAFSAGGKYLRAAVYHFTAERMATHGDPAKARAYQGLLDCFGKGVRLRGEAVEPVEIPYEGKTLPALFCPAPGPGPAPCLIAFDGFDATKEWTWLCGLPAELRRRGIACLIVDHPGVGGALRLHGLSAVADTERPAGACIDWLETRAEVDPRRIGIVAMSMGGYFAPRAAAFEKRLAACIAWGARWDNDESHGRILRDPDAARSVTAWLDHAMWVYGTKTVEETAAAIAAMTLEGIAGRITCPILVVHGAGDRQVPFDHVQRTIDGCVNSPRRDARVFGRDEGGFEHVGVDNLSLQIDVMADWTAEVLGGRLSP